MEGYRFYENQAPGIGSYFLGALYSDIDSLIVNAGIHPVCFGHYHRLLNVPAIVRFNVGPRRYV